MDSPNNANNPEDAPMMPGPASREDDGVEQVEAERIGGPEMREGGFSTPNGGISFGFSSFTPPGGPLQRPPVLATWLCLAVAWLALGSKIPFTVLIGVPFNLAALILATMSLGRGGVFTGFSVLILGTVGSILVYLVGLFRFLFML